MAKQVIWSKTAKEQRKEILEYWAERTGDRTYSKKLSKKFREKIKYIVQYNYIGTATDVENVRVAVCGNYLMFYELDEKFIKILAIWDGRRDPDIIPYH